MPVNTPNEQYTEALPKWQRLRDCFGGRDAVLARGNLYVPDLPGATEGANRAYRERGNFYNAVRRTVQGLVGLIFQDPPEVEDGQTVEPLLDDVSPRGLVPFETFASDVTKEVVKVGRVGVLVDMPRAAAGAPLESVRPYAAFYRAEDVIGWLTGRQGADDVLVEVRLKEEEVVIDAKDRWATTCQPRVRVLALDDAGYYYQQRYEPKDPTAGWTSKEWLPIDDPVYPERKGKKLDFIPFMFVNPTGVGPDIEDPPLLDLADVNLSHFRNSCDHEHGLHLIALPTPWVAGAKGSDSGGPMKIGPSVVWELEKGGQAGMLEFQGSGLASIKDAMEDKKRQMATLGARLLDDTEADGAETATGVRMRHSGQQATVKTIAGASEQGLTQVVRWLGWWDGIAATPADVPATVELNKEYFAVRASSEEVRALVFAWQSEAISFDTMYAGLQKGKWTRENIDADEERKAIEKENPPAPKPPPVPPPPLPGQVPPAPGPQPPKPQPQGDGDSGE